MHSVIESIKQQTSLENEKIRVDIVTCPVFAAWPFVASVASADWAHGVHTSPLAPGATKICPSGLGGEYDMMCNNMFFFGVWNDGNSTHIVYIIFCIYIYTYI